MLVSHAWLNEWVATPAVDKLAERLTLGGLAVESVAAAGAVLDKKTVVGRVVSVDQHPASPALRVCKVDTGKRSPLTIVCGATNAVAGVTAAVATVGATLPTVRVAKKNINGVESAGMICSAAELGLEESSDGVLILDDDAPLGAPVGDHLNLADTVLELEVTPNRGDCLSMLGVAREVSALTGATMRARANKNIRATNKTKLPVKLAAPAGCPRYVGRAVCGVDVGARTPDWMRERLRRAGVRSLNVVVDVTNYVMLELGQPMHAFDFDKLAGGIVVRNAKKNERLKLLDGAEKSLSKQHLVIADHKKAVALAGIMGGEATAISGATRNIYFEAAFFPAPTIIGKARKLGMHTDASHRFERGVDPAMQAVAMQRATGLLVALAGGEPGPVTDARAAKSLPAAATIRLRRADIRRTLGATVPAATVTKLLKRLGMKVRANATGWTVTTPSWRFDLTGAHDLVEEVGRVHGFDKIKPRPPAATATGGHRERALGVGALRDTLIARGYFEAMTYSFVEPAVQRALTGGDGVALANPIADAMSVMRRSLWPGLVAAVKGNLNRRHERVRLFETGQVFLTDGDNAGDHRGGVGDHRGRAGDRRGVAGDHRGRAGDHRDLAGDHRHHREVHRLAAAATGAVLPTQWGAPPRAVDFFDLKGDLAALLALSAHTEIEYAAADHPALHPGRSAAVKLAGKVAGHLGQLHPRHQAMLDLEQPVYLLELDLSALHDAPLPAAAPVSKFPALRRDLAVVVGEATQAQDVLDAARAAAGDRLAELELFDIYAGEGVGDGKKSFAFRLTFRSECGNLTSLDADADTEHIVRALQNKFGAKLRA